MISKEFAVLFCSTLRLGYFSKFPGTIASIFTLPLVWIIKTNFGVNFLFLIVICYSIISYFSIKIVLKDSKNKDPSFIISDEHIGQSIALFFCEEALIDYLISFLLFRFLDIKKPYPINLIDKIKNPIGVIGDDVAAGVMVCLLFICKNEF